VHLDWTISVGNILTAGILLLGFITAHIQNVRKLQEIESRLGMIYEWFKHNVLGRYER